ncbi:uncharacterized protein LOC134632147 [Pelmatolapia mariae]|uniref:uncharacterized protein LOC134632147 n=1 Tax=Pelmatolapia mariae TaxID=158779 RepID=UPI002FE658E6
MSSLNRSVWPAAPVTSDLAAEQTCPSYKQFMEYKKSKSKERQAFSCGAKLKLKQQSKPVKINIGIMVSQQTDLKPVRGKTLPLSISPEITAPDLLKQAVEKMRAFNKDLVEGPYVLLYPDCTEVINVPGSERPFRLADYKEEIGKNYNRISLFICPESHFKQALIAEDGTSDSDPEIVITSRSTAEFNQADTLVFKPQDQSTPNGKHAEKEFKEGLSALNFLSALQQHPTLLSPVLCHMEKKLTALELERLFKPDFSPSGSNRRRLESQTVGYWSDYLLDCEESQTAVSVGDVLMFATGLTSLPPSGLDPLPSLQFLDDSLFPMAKTCLNLLKLPMITSYSVFKSNMDFGIQNSPGFGCF